MPLTQLNLNPQLSFNSAFNTLLLTDSTGAYNALLNPFGYGSTNGVAINNVTGLVITLNYTTLGVSAVYTFTVSSGTITGCTINFNAIGAVNVLSQINTTVFPLTNFAFLNNYINTVPATVILPSLEDGAYNVTYEITGIATVSGTPTAFDLTAQDTILQKLSTQCCIDEAFNNADIDCNCEEAKIIMASRSNSYLYTAQLAVINNDSTRANLYLNKAKTICDCGCGC
jgi:hypothetical protein